MKNTEEYDVRIHITWLSDDMPYERLPDKAFIGMSMANFMDASFGSIYPTLKRLKQKGMVSSKDVIGGGKLTKVYTIQNKGKQAFSEWLKEPVSVGNAKTNTSYKASFSLMRWMIAKKRALRVFHTRCTAAA